MLDAEGLSMLASVVVIPAVVVFGGCFLEGFPFGVYASVWAVAAGGIQKL